MMCSSNSWRGLWRRRAELTSLRTANSWRSERSKSVSAWAGFRSPVVGLFRISREGMAVLMFVVAAIASVT
jgi:hypothetical protein